MAETKTYSAINFAEKLAKFSDQWQPRVIAELNDYQFKIVRIEGDFIWHDHPTTDEAFLADLLAIASGRKTAAERAGQRAIAIWKKGVTL